MRDGWRSTRRSGVTSRSSRAGATRSVSRCGTCSRIPPGARPGGRSTGGRRLGTRGPLRQRARPVTVRSHAARRRRVGLAAADPRRDGRRVHAPSGTAAGVEPGARLGHAGRVGLHQRRRDAVAPGVRTHRVHGHVAVDGPGPGPVHHPADQPRASHAREHGDPPRPSPCRRPGGRRAHASRAMSLNFTDWLIIVVYFAASAAIGIYYTGRAGRSVAEYFVSGRSLPWWLAGTSMVATTFAADTPLAVSGLVAKYGVAGNWLWWNLALSGMLTVFFFSRLWRRAGVMTDVELTELRYGGKPAALLRGARALYLGLPINLIIMGWVTRAMVTILDATLGLNGLRAAIVLLVITAGYSMLSGLWGVVMTDLFQFIFAMGGSIVLAVMAVRATGGLDRLVELTAAHFGSHGAAFGILPPLDRPWL